MPTPLQWGIGIVVGVLASSALASGNRSPAKGGGVHKVTIWRMLESLQNLTPTQRYFLMLVAYGEGGYRPSAHNGSDGERDAARRALERNPSIAERANLCGIPLDNLRSGSWGTFQRLAPYWASDMFEIFGGAGCPFADPTQHTDNLALQIADAIHLARSLQGYSGWRAAPTVGNLRLGWANPSFMGYLSKHADRIDKYKRHAASQRFPPGIVDAQISLFPANAAGIYQQLQGG